MWTFLGLILEGAVFSTFLIVMGTLLPTKILSLLPEVSLSLSAEWLCRGIGFNLTGLPFG
jgi:hypothetical protein